MSSPAGPRTRASSSSVDARLEQPLAALRLRPPRADRADVERSVRERGRERRNVELLVVREDDDRRVAVGRDLRERLLGPLDDQLVGARDPLGVAKSARASTQIVCQPSSPAAAHSASAVSTAPTTTSRGGGP